MRSVLRSIRRFLSELKRRNVYQVAVTYVVVGFFVIEGADLVLTRLGLPGWTVTFVIVLVGLGFPIALVLAWALEMTPEGVRVEEPEGSEETAPASTSSPRDLWVGASVLALLLFGAWWLWGGLGNGEAVDQAESRAPEIEERSIAVLPFEVSGSGAEEWRDGMVTALSLNLDGAAGLRAIADRTVFAAWQKHDSATAGASVEKALAVAREMGARYAVVGSALQLGGELRLGTDVRKVASGERLGQVEVRGSPDSVTALADRLTREVLGVLLEKSEEQIPSVDLASITTESLPALKAYLEGERHYRAGEYEAAIGDYERAVQQDSTFALAYARLDVSRGWAVLPAQGSLQRAYGLSDRLPSRKRRLVRARYIWQDLNHPLAAADTLRRLSDEYPDDPSVWHYLGETLYHGVIPGGWPEAEKAFEEAVRLDPGVAPHHHHLVQLAFSLHRDSALAAERIEAHPDGPINRVHRLAWDLVFGPAENREEALARVGRIPIPHGTPALLFGPLGDCLRHPTHGTLREKVLLGLREREDLDRTFATELLRNSLRRRGQIERPLTRLPGTKREAPNAGCLLARSMSLGAPLPDSLLRSLLEPSKIEKDAQPSQLMCAGIYLVEKGRSGELPAVIDRFEAAGAEQGLSNGKVQRQAQELQGYRAFRAGALKQAERLLGGHNESGRVGAIWRGDLYREMGNLEEAEGWYLAGWEHPVAHERLGRLYEEMGRPEEAREAYRRLIEAWEEADPELQERVTEARERLDALGEKRAAE